MKFDFKDICLVPASITNISSRSQINVKVNGTLPLMTAPMDTVISKDNYAEFKLNGIIPCLPRTKNSKIKFYDDTFTSMSLDEFIFFIDDYPNNVSMYEKINILIDVANGHMDVIGSIVKKFINLREKNGKTNLHRIMVGNIANPETYRHYAKIGVDFVRVGIGGGSGCLTSANTGIHFPMASLIAECYEIKKENKFITKIVADGGMKNYDDVIKALALGADYVMMGGILNKTVESCGKTILFGFIRISNTIAYDLWKNFPFLRKHMTKSFRGMSTKVVQKSWGRTELKTSEGIVKINEVKYTLSQWTENFEDYLKSAMSYTNSIDLESFKGSEYTFITENALKRFDK